MMLDISKDINFSNNYLVIEICSGDYGSDLIEQMITCVKKLPIPPISQTKYELEFDTQNPKVFWLDQFKTLIKRMLLQLYRNRVRIKYILYIISLSAKWIYIVIQKNLRKLILKNYIVE